MASLQRISRRQALARFAAFGLAELGSGVLLNSYRFEVNRYKVALEGVRAPLRLVQISDLHYGPFVHESSVRAWVAAAEERPDVVVISDLVDSRLHRPLSPFRDALAGLGAPLGVWGNHDRVRFSDAQAFERVLKGSGIDLLVNRSVLLRDDVYVAGVDDFLKGTPDAEAALRACPPETASLLLCHNPGYLPHVTRNVSFTFCGHTHGGQVRLPWWVLPLPRLGTASGLRWVSSRSRCGRLFQKVWASPFSRFASCACRRS